MKIMAKENDMNDIFFGRDFHYKAIQHVHFLCICSMNQKYVL